MEGSAERTVLPRPRSLCSAWDASQDQRIRLKVDKLCISASNCLSLTEADLYFIVSMQ
jgi:hypothetical protein